MTEREKLEREVRQLTQIMRANAFALARESTPHADRAGLQRQMEVRAAMRRGVSKQLGCASNLAVGRGAQGNPHAQAAAYSRSQAHEGNVVGDR
jgi:hypothetical protein